MNCCLNKNINSGSKNWISLINSVEMRQKRAVRPYYANLYAYAANNPVRYIDPDGNSPFSFFIQKIENSSEPSNKYKTIKRTTVKITFRVYSGNKSTLQDFKNRYKFRDGEIYEYDKNEIPDVLSDCSDLLEKDNIIIVTEEKNITTKYDDTYGEYKTSEKEKIILIYEKRGDEYVKTAEIYDTND